MNEQLIKYLEGFESRLGNVEDFAAAEIPLFVQEFLMWNWWNSFIWASVCLIPVVVIFVVLLRSWYRAGKTLDIRKESDAQIGFFFALISIAIIASTSIVAVEGVKEGAKCLKISVAPRVFLVEESAKLMGRR
jgi:hypothetical protein